MSVWVVLTSMERHWTLDLVALLGILAGFVLATGQGLVLGGVVAAASAYALVLPEFVGADATASRTAPLENDALKR